MSEPLPPHAQPKTIFWVFAHWVWHGIAIFGLIVLMAGAWFYWEGRRTIARYEPDFLPMAVNFVKQTLRSDVASALVVRLPVKPEINPDTVVEAMKLRAEKLHIPLINHYVMHKTLEKKTGKPARVTEILEFCSVEKAYAVLEHNMDYLAHMPCRIALHEDNSGKLWILTMNLNLLIHGSKGMSADMKIQALSIQDALLDIMAAGADGDLQ